LRVTITVSRCSRCSCTQMYSFVAEACYVPSGDYPSPSCPRSSSRRSSQSAPQEQRELQYHRESHHQHRATPFRKRARHTITRRHTTHKVTGFHGGSCCPVFYGEEKSTHHRTSQSHHRVITEASQSHHSVITESSQSRSVTESSLSSSVTFVITSNVTFTRRVTRVRGHVVCFQFSSVRVRVRVKPYRGVLTRFAVRGRRYEKINDIHTNTTTTIIIIIIIITVNTLRTIIQAQL